MSETKRRAVQRAYHFVYKTVCSVTGKYYIGLHSTDDLNDKYLGSGWRLHSSIKKYGAEAHSRTILEQLPDRKSAATREKEIVTSDLLKDPMCLNLCVGGQGNYLDRPTEESTRKKLSETGKARWARDRSKLKEKVHEELAKFSMKRKEILEVLVTPEGHLNKNATRCLLRKDEPTLGDDKLGKREVLRRAKWNFIREAIRNSEFGEDPVELINAYVFKLKKRPVCKTCSERVSFFRFGQPYATYCGNRCQLLDKEFKNPVWSRYRSTSVS